MEHKVTLGKHHESQPEMKRTFVLSAIALLGLSITACSTDTSEPVAETTTTTSTPQATDQTEWTTLDDIADAIDQVNGGCDALIKQDGMGACGTSETGVYTFAINTAEYPMVSATHRLSTATTERDHNQSVIFGNSWSIHCSETYAEPNCTSLQKEIATKGRVDLPPGGVDEALDSMDSESEETSASSFSDGTHLVGKDIQPGTYRYDGSKSSCYWERLSGLGGTSDDIIANDLVNGQTFVTIEATDKAFKSNRCGLWTLVEEAPSADVNTNSAPAAENIETPAAAAIPTTTSYQYTPPAAQTTVTTQTPVVGITGAPGTEPIRELDKTISSCGDPTMHQTGTTFFTDGTSGWTEFCSEQMLSQ